MEDALNNLITASHILHYHGVLDAYGHVSLRNPENNRTFFLSRSIPPALISSKSDLVEYKIENAEPVRSGASTGYSERCIHSEVLKRFPAVNSVVHSHSPEILPYCICDVPLRPTIHMAGFLGTEVPMFEIGNHYRPGDSHDFLVKNTHLGEALATHFTKSQATYVKVGASIVNRITGSHTEVPNEPDHCVVLMRGHGFTTVASSIEQAVYQAIYTHVAAKAQATALTVHSAHFGAKLDGRSMIQATSSKRVSDLRKVSTI